MLPSFVCPTWWNSKRANISVYIRTICQSISLEFVYIYDNILFKTINGNVLKSCSFFLYKNEWEVMKSFTRKWQVLEGS